MSDAKAFEKRHGAKPGLAVIIVGDRKDSQTYVRNKETSCSECNIASTKHELPCVPARSAPSATATATSAPGT